MKHVLIILSTIVLLSCYQEPIKPANPEGAANKNKTYTIQQGNHYADGLNFSFHSGKEWLNFEASFYPSCIYDLGDNDNYDINKLRGLTWGLMNDDNSFRIGWNCEKQNGKIQLHYYIHDRGAMRYGYITEVSPGEWFSFSINFDRTGIFIHPDGSKTVGVIHIYITSHNLATDVSFNFSGIPKSGYYNYPYFGGNEVAPHTMKMIVN